MSKIQSNETEIAEETLKLNVAEKLIDDGNNTMSDVVSELKLDKSSAAKAQMILNAGITSSMEIKSKIEDLKKDK